MKKAAILVPSPYVADNHQYKNAMALHHKGAGVCVEEKTLAEGALTVAVKQLLDDPARVAHMEQAIFEEFAVPEANETIVKELLALIRG